MKNTIEDLEKEQNILTQTLNMYNKTKEEMVIKNLTNSIGSIDSEIDIASKRIDLTDRMINALKEGNNDEYQGLLNEYYQLDGIYDYNQIMKDTEELNKCLTSNTVNGIPVRKRKKNKKLDLNPVSVNHFLVNFPKESNIEPYMVESFQYTACGQLEVNIREFEGIYPILPLVINNLKNKKININIDILTYSEDVYYTMHIKNAELIDECIIYPKFTYKEQGLNVYTLLFEVEEITYSKPIENETTNKERIKLCHED